MKMGLSPFDRARWKSFQAAIASPQCTSAQQRAKAIHCIQDTASDALSHLRASPRAARHDIKLMDRVLQQAVRQRAEGQPAWRRFMQAVWRALRLPDKLVSQQRQAHALAKRVDHRWCAEDERFLQLMDLFVLEAQSAEGEDKMTLLHDDRVFFDRYLRKLHKRTKLIPLCKERTDEAGEVALQLLRIKRDLHGKFSVDNLTRLLDKTTALRAKGDAVKKSDLLSVEEFGLLSKFGDALTVLRKMSDEKILPQEYQQSLQLLTQLQEFVGTALDEITQSSQNRPGDVELESMPLLLRSYGVAMPWMGRAEQILTRSNFGHAAVTLLNGRRAEMNGGGYFRGRPDPEQQVAMTAYRLDWERLVTRQGKGSLQQAWGPEWAQTLQQVFENRVTSLVTAPELQTIPFDEAIHRVPFRLRLQRKPANVTGLDAESPMFCAEFAARSLAVTLHGLEADLREVGEMPTARVFHRLFAKHENFKATSPGHLARRLRPYTREVPQATALGQYVDLRVPSRWPWLTPSRPSRVAAFFGSNSTQKSTQHAARR